MELDKAVALLGHSKGYCLWVGGGVTIQLASAGLVKLPTWTELAARLESHASIAPPSTTISLPARLDAIMNALGQERFRSELRETILKPIGEAVLKAARRHQDPERCVPPEIRQFARLGALANPIVNFSLETFTSRALAQPGGPFVTKSFSSSGANAKGAGEGSYDGRRFRRLVYHPHGATDGSIGAITESEYASRSGLLALQLAAHAAFGSRLVIVGMSLEDAYLRDQLAQFRQHLHDVIWFQEKEPRPELVRWAKKHEVVLVTSGDWKAFWKKVGSALPEPEELQIVSTWLSLVSTAMEAMNPKRQTFPVNEIKKSRASREKIERWRQVAASSGITVAEKEPRAPTEPEEFATSKNDVLRPIMTALFRLS